MSNVNITRLLQLMCVVIIAGCILYSCIDHTSYKQRQPAAQEDYSQLICTETNSSTRKCYQKVRESIPKVGQRKTLSGTGRPVMFKRRQTNHKTFEGPKLRDKKIVIIIAYMRTGSTLIASIFQEYPGAFYVFEPIRGVTNAFNKKRTYTTIKYLHGKEKIYTLDEKEKAIEKDVDAWLTCDLKSVSLLSLTDESNRKQDTRITNKLYKCIEDLFQNGSRRRFQQPIQLLYDRFWQSNVDQEKLDKCLESAVTACKDSSVTVLKFIRLRMKSVGKLLRKYPNMKVIHLVRDPRGIINSRVNIQNGDNDPKSLCENLLDDLIALKSLSKKVSDRIKTVRYEDMAHEPVETTKEFIKFTDLNFTEHMNNFVREQTFSGKDSDPYKIRRKNSTETANRWRLEISLKNARLIYDTCKRSNEILGYLPLDTLEELRDLGKPSMYKSYI